MAQTKQTHRNANVTRFIENGRVVGYEGTVPANTTEDDWLDAVPFDPYAYLSDVQLDRQRRRNLGNSKRTSATRAMYLKLIEKGYSEADAKSSTGYAGE